MLGVPPQSSIERKRDDHMETYFRELERLYSKELIALVRWSLALDPLKRPQSVYALQKMMRPVEQKTEPPIDASSPSSLLARFRRVVR
jgi:hypothetical protein